MFQRIAMSSVVALTFAAGATIAAGALFAGCSSSSSTRAENTISPYDDQFEPSAEDKAKADSKRDETAAAGPTEETDLLVEAMHYYDTGLFTAAKESFQKLQEKFPSSYYSVLAELKVADCNYNLSEYATAISQYQEFERLHPKHEAIPYVVLQIGNSNFAQYRGVMHDQSPAREALKYFERVVNEFPASSYALTAAQSIARCKETVAAHEAYVAEFYLKQGQTDASRNRLGYLQKEYGTSDVSKAATQLLASDLDVEKTTPPAAAPAPAAPKPQAIKRSALALLAAETIPQAPVAGAPVAVAQMAKADAAQSAAAPERKVDSSAKSADTAVALQSSPAPAVAVPSSQPTEASSPKAAAAATTNLAATSAVSPPAQVASAQVAVKQAQPTKAELAAARARLDAKPETSSSSVVRSREPVVIAASLSCEEREGKKVLTAQFAPDTVSKATLVSTAETGGASRSLTIEVDVKPRADSGLAAVFTQTRCGSKSAGSEMRFSEVETAPQKRRAGIRSVRVEIPLSDAQQWRVMKLEQPERLVALVF